MAVRLLPPFRQLISYVCSFSIARCPACFANFCLMIFELRLEWNSVHEFVSSSIVPSLLFLLDVGYSSRWISCGFKVRRGLPFCQYPKLGVVLLDFRWYAQTFIMRQTLKKDRISVTAVLHEWNIKYKAVNGRSLWYVKSFQCWCNKDEFIHLFLLCREAILFISI